MHIEDDLVLVSRRWRQLAVDGGHLQQEVFSLQELRTYLQVSRLCLSVAETCSKKFSPCKSCAPICK